MGRMRENLSQKASATLYVEVPPDRRNVQSRELKAVLDRVNPSGDGHILLKSMRKELTKLMPPPADVPRHAKRMTSASVPSLLTLEQRQLSQYDQYVAAFNAVDLDGSGTISKRELYQVLKKAGVANGKQALEMFEGFDRDGGGSLDLEEFCRIASILC